jgi:hypothetical protein
LPVEKNGRTVFLLKSKAKPQAAERKKRKFELLLPALDVQPMDIQDLLKQPAPATNTKKKIIPEFVQKY